MRNDYHNLSLKGSCHIFANTIAQKLNTPVWMIVHENPLWDNDNVSYQEFIDSKKGPNVSIIHAFVELPDHTIFDTNGVFHANNTPLSTLDENFKNNLVDAILPTVFHADIDTDPISVLKFTSSEFNEIIHTQTDEYELYHIHQLFTDTELKTYQNWILNKIKR